MAAFINAIYEEGTRSEALYWLQKERNEKGLDILPDSAFEGWTKSDLCKELSRIWYGHE